VTNTQSASNQIRTLGASKHDTRTKPLQPFLIDACHLQAALAVWDYCRASARLLFDTAPIDPTDQRIGQALDVASEGLTRMQMRALFHRHVSKERIDLALEQLLRLGLINRETSTGRGQATTLWTRPQNPDTNATPCEAGPYGA
jgi:hypothetical protein